MPENAGPREVFARLLHAIEERDWEAMDGIYAPDAVVDVLFAPPKPVRLAGVTALREHFDAARGLALRMRVRNVVVHETADPEVLVVEFDYEGRSTETGRTFEVPNITVVRVRDGRIVASRDYHNHLAITDALGQLPSLVEALESARAA